MHKHLSESGPRISAPVKFWRSLCADGISLSLAVSNTRYTCFELLNTSVKKSDIVVLGDKITGRVFTMNLWRAE